MVRLGAGDRRRLASGRDLKSQPIVFLVDAEQGTARAVSRSLRMAGHEVRSFLSSRDFLAGHDVATPGCAVVDFAMPGLSGLELLNVLAMSGNRRPIVFMSRNADVASSVQAMKQGAIDFLTKPVSDRDLLAAVQCALERDRQLRKTWAELQSIGARLATLTRREREVFHHIVMGRRNKQIAAGLGTVEKTIKAHRSNIMKKMNAGSLPDLVRMAVQAERAG